MCLLNITRLFLSLQCLLLSSTIAIPTPPPRNPAVPSYDLYVEDHTGKLVRLDRSNPSHMKPDPMYEGLPMTTQWNEYGEVEHVVQIELLDVPTYRKHFLSGPSWENITLTDEDIEDIRQSHFNISYDPKPYHDAKRKKALRKRFGELMFMQCDEYNPIFISTSLITSINRHSKGRLHVVSQQICSPVTASYSTTVSHTSSVGYSASVGGIPYVSKAADVFLKKAAQTVLLFLKEFSVSVSPSEANGVTYGYTYTANCAVAKTSCYLVEQPLITVRKGRSIHLGFTPNGDRCNDFDFKTEHFETHTVYKSSSPNAAVWDECFTTRPCPGFKPVVPAGALVCTEDQINGSNGKPSTEDWKRPWYDPHTGGPQPG